MGKIWLLVYAVGVMGAFFLLYYVWKRVHLESEKPGIMEDEYDPMSVLEDLGRNFLSMIGDKDVELFFEIDRNLPKRLYGDADWIRRVIGRLMEISIKNTEQGYVKLLIKVYPVVENELIEMYVSVKDTGCGLPVSPRRLKKIDAGIRAKSEEGVGTEFWFSIRQKVVVPERAVDIKCPENWILPRLSARFSKPYQEDALMTLVNMYKLSYIPYDILQDVGLTVDYLFTDREAFLELEQEMMECVREKTCICVIENPLLGLDRLPGVTMVPCPFFSLNFCRLLNHEPVTTELQ